MDLKDRRDLTSPKMSKEIVQGKEKEANVRSE